MKLFYHTGKLGTYSNWFVNSFEAKPSMKLITNAWKLTLLSVWGYLVLIIFEQSYFMARHNTFPENLYLWMKVNNMFGWRDFMYGEMRFLLAFIKLVFEFSFFSLIASVFEFQKNITFKPIIKMAVGAYLLAISILFLSNSFLWHILEIPLFMVCFRAFNSAFLHIDNTLMKSWSSYNRYLKRILIKLWLISNIALIAWELFYVALPLSYSNGYIVVKLTLLLSATVFTTILVNQIKWCVTHELGRTELRKETFKNKTYEKKQRNE